NGFLVGSLEAAVAGVRAAVSMDRTLVRASVERRFDSNRMVDDYLEVYHRVVALDHARRADSDAGPARVARSVSARCQLLAGSNGDGVVVGLRSCGGRRRFRTDRRERSRLDPDLPDLGGLPTDPEPGGSANAGSSDRRGGSGRGNGHGA